MVLGRSFLVAAFTTAHGRIHHYCSLLQILFPTRFQKGTQMVHMNDAWSPRVTRGQDGPLGCWHAAPPMSTQLQFGILCDAKHSTRKNSARTCSRTCVSFTLVILASHTFPVCNPSGHGGKDLASLTIAQGLLKTSSALQR